MNLPGYDAWRLATPPHYDHDESLALEAAEYFGLDPDDVDAMTEADYLEERRIEWAERKAGL